MYARVEGDKWDRFNDSSATAIGMDQGLAKEAYISPRTPCNALLSLVGWMMDVLA